MRHLDFSFKSLAPVNEEGNFSGLAATFDSPDSEGEFIDRGAFSKNLMESNVRPLLWQHDVKTPLGVAYLEETPKGLGVLGSLCMEVQRSREIRSLMAQGVVTGLSLGFETIRAVQDRQTRARRVVEAKIWEVSPCVFPQNPAARIRDVKSMTPEKAKQLIRDYEQVQEIFVRNHESRLKLWAAMDLHERLKIYIEGEKNGTA